VRLPSPEGRADVGRVTVITAGTTDRPVAEEAVETLRWMGCGVDLIVDGGVRKKDTQSGFFGAVPFASPLPSFSSTYNDATLQTWSITPRLSVKNSIFGIPSQILTGIDYYDATFNQERGAFKGLAPTHIYDLSQQTLAGYWQHTVGLLPTTDFSYGARVQNTSLSARDRYDPEVLNRCMQKRGYTVRQDG
jgi:hypothetical protein